MRVSSGKRVYIPERDLVEYFPLAQDRALPCARIYEIYHFTRGTLLSNVSKPVNARTYSIHIYAGNYCQLPIIGATIFNCIRRH